MNITIPEFSLVILIGASGSGKSTFARTHFKPTEILSSDFCRGLVSDDENDQTVTKEAFEVLHFIAAKRLAAKRLTVVDATNVQPESRKPLLELARQYHCLPVALCWICRNGSARNATKPRPDRNFGAHVIAHQRQQLRRSLKNLKREGFHHIYTLHSEEDIATASVERTPLWNDRTLDHGPFDIIGDVHGCYDELITLLDRTRVYGSGRSRSNHRKGAKRFFWAIWWIAARKSRRCLRLVMGMVAAGTALCIPGNHDTKLMRALRGKQVQITHGLAKSLQQLESETAEFKEQVAEFIYAPCQSLCAG